MSNAKICDRCGTFYVFEEPKHTHFNLIETKVFVDGRKKSKKLDLCLDCMKALIRFVDEGRVRVEKG